MSKIFILLCLSFNIIAIFAFPKEDWKEEYNSPKGRHWEYGTKIKHPAHKKHYKSGDKGWTHTYDSGNEDHNQFIPVKHEIDDQIAINLAPIEIPKYDTDLGHEYSPKEHFHYEPISKPIDRYEPKIEFKKEEPKKSEFDLPDVNIEGIIDDIQKDLKKTDYIAKA